MLFLSVPIGILIGVVLGLVGSGGALLSTPLLLLSGHFDFQDASSSALIVVFTSSALALAIRDKSEIPRKLIVTAIFWGAIGSPLGVFASHYVTSNLSKVILTILLLLAAFLTWNADKNAKTGPLRAGNPFIEGTLFTFVGVMTGLTGIGGGYILVPVLHLVSGLKFRQAITASLYVVVFNSLIALGLRAIGGINLTSDQWISVGIVVTAALLGTIAGALLSNRLNKGFIQRIFAILLIALAASLILQISL